MNTKQVILIRRDLKMRRGKEVAQGGHAASAFLMEIVRTGRELTGCEKAWMDGLYKKVCLVVESEAELRELHEKAQAAGLTSHMILDSGLTEFAGVPTLTSCAIGPAEEEAVNAITGHLKLY